MMKISIPGKALRMQEKLAKEVEKYHNTDERSRYQMPYMSWICPDILDHPCSRLADNNPDNLNAMSTLWDQRQNVSHHFNKDEILTHRTRCQRPSTAIRRHVKKITEDFTNTTLRGKNGGSASGVFIQIDSSELNRKDDRKPPGSLNVLFSPKTQHRKMIIRGNTLCSKCSHSKNQVMPLVTPPPVGSVKKLNKLSLLNVCNSPRTSSNSSEQGIFPVAPTASPSLPRQRKQTERLNPAKCLRRRKSQSANASISKGILKVPFEQVKKAKLFAEKAVKEGKVFAIHGGFPAIREALVKRGWVEKVLHTIPYVNPHPQNCVCTHVGWHVTNAPHQHPLNQISPSECTASVSSGGAGSLKLINSPKEPKRSTPSLKGDTSSSESGKSNQEEGSPNEEEEDTEERASDQDHEGEPLSTEICDSSSSCDVLNINPDVEEKNSEMAIKDPFMDIPLPELEEEIHNGEDLQNNQNVSSEYLKKIARTLNPNILCPSEIREGIHKSINEKNLCIFQYSVPPYERKRNQSSLIRNLDSKSLKIDPSPTGETCHRLPPEEINDRDKNYNMRGGDEKSGNMKYEQEDDEEGKEKVEKENKKEFQGKPFNPFPKLDYILTNLDKPVVARVLRNVEPNFIWSWNRDSISFKHLSKEQLVNRFPNTPFTTKFGLCETLQQLHWFSEAASVDTFVPRGYCIGHEDERAAFIHDYRTTACLNILKWMTEGSSKKGNNSVAHQMGEVPIRRVRQALQHVERFIQSCCHDDLDTPPLSPLRENEWDLILAAHHRIIHQGKKVKALPHHAETLLRECESALERVDPFWPQLQMDGVRNVWIVKPGAQSRGRGIFLLNHLEEILSLVQSPLIYQTKYVVQKYMERPLLIHNTKFDIRQWFMVTDWNPLTVWMYKDSYLRFCSQQYDLTNNDEAIHLSNNAIQCKYMNGERDKELPEENMWDCHEFKEYLKSHNQDDAYETIIYPGMRDALVATMLAAQVQMDSFKHGFEFFGADFMLTEDLRPWLIEINSSPCMASTTSVTRRMCYECLNDTIKVVVDYRQNKSADTGKFDLIYHDKEKSVSNLPYHGVNLQVVGRQIWKPFPKADKRRSKKIRPMSKVPKSIPLITLHLEESGNISLAKACPLLNCQNYSQKGPTLTTIVTTPSKPSTNKCYNSFTEKVDGNEQSE